MQSIQKSSKVFLVEPRVYAEAQDIADQLKNRRAVVVNLQRIEKDQGKRIIDFLSGTVYAIGGDIQKIGTDIFLCTPDNVEVSGNISQILQDAEYENTRW
ncbi:cell division protein sepF [Niallia nealsonii AAU1]|nr:cell division protein sepF [Niallia nealsonii AAU1]